MNLSITIIDNGFVLTLQTPQNGMKSLFFPTKELCFKMVEEIFKGIQHVPVEPVEANVVKLPTDRK